MATISFIGTKLHQHTRKAISRRKPALMTAIRKFNKYCLTLEKLYNPSWNIPLPLPLSTQLATLRDQPGLMEDVWVSPSPLKVPRWLDDPDVREGIRAMLKQDRCDEESRRLRCEADNVSGWLRREMAAVYLALCMPSCKPLPSSVFVPQAHLILDSHLSVLLQQRHLQLVHMKMAWLSPLISAPMVEQTSEMSAVLHRLSHSTSTAGHTATPNVIFNCTEDLDDAEYADLLDTPPEGTHEVHDSRETLIADILQAEQDDAALDAEDTADLVHADSQVQLLWELPVRVVSIMWSYAFTLPHLV
jgi:hypothetical protein